MAFTYSEALSAARDKLRLNIGDTQVNAGPRPDNRNYSDAELTYILTQEDDRLNGATAFTFELLANEWEAFSIQESDSQVSYNAKDKAKDFDARAAIWRKKPNGSADATQSSGIAIMTRSDAYT